MEDPNNRRQTRLICLGLALAILAAYAPLWDCGFAFYYDDGDYIVSNPMVQHGLSLQSIAWAFTSQYADNWHPLTWISHILDFQLFGRNPAGHHFTSLVLHIANSILLFLLLRRITKLLWPSALAAALFALHPMHVESVAWIAERKDVLSTFFWMLTLWAYVRYVENSKIQNPKSRIYYSLSLFFFALGLMSKPMVVTLPFVLLLLDYWPLERGWPAVRLLTEKAPFLILAAASCVVEFLAQKHGGSVSSLSDLGWGERFAGIPISYAGYVEKTLWPAHLALLYPLVREWPVWQTAAAAAFLALLTGFALFRLRTRPYLAVGWLWFLGTLVPVIGLVQVGVQFMADRYNYIPSIGLFIMIIWGARECLPRLGKNAPPVLGLIALVGCMALTWVQVGYWNNNEKLFLHTLNVTTDNGRIEGLLGQMLLDQGRVDEALPHLQRSVLLPHPPPRVLPYLGNALLSKGQVAEALRQFELDATLYPDNPASQFTFGCVLLTNGLPAKAIPHLQTAIQILPNIPDFHYKLANAFMQTGQIPEAIRQFEDSLRLRPDYIEASVNLAWILSCSPDPSLRDGKRAVILALRADQLSGGKNPRVLGALAAAYAETGNYSDAIATLRRALELAGSDTTSAVAGTLRSELALYQAGSPMRDPMLQPPPTNPPGR